jgi:3',5'-cyclic AMP phosphodiesterase CpdA
MRTLVHMSDLHFGRVDERLLQPLIDTVGRIAPDLLVISGDLTQRARTHQFKQARAFLDALPAPRLVVPGNHDVPLYNVLARMLHPLDKYRRYVTGDLEPFFGDDEIAVLGINSARSLTIKNGRINRRQLDQVRTRLAHLPDTVSRIVVTHHPVDLPQGTAADDLVGRAHLAMETFADCRVDLLLSGHLHHGDVGNTATRYRIKGYSALVIHAGTATSTRRRSEVNSFNVVRVNRPEVAVERWVWDAAGATFSAEAAKEFVLKSGGWHTR